MLQSRCSVRNDVFRRLRRSVAICNQRNGFRNEIRGVGLRRTFQHNRIFRHRQGRQHCIHNTDHQLFLRSASSSRRLRILPQQPVEQFLTDTKQRSLCRTLQATCFSHHAYHRNVSGQSFHYLGLSRQYENPLGCFAGNSQHH